MSYLTKNITLHYLINEDNPYCLYCKNKCDSSISSTIFATISTYNCLNCHEKFRIHENYLGAVNAFMFTCDTVVVGIYYDTENLFLSKRDENIINNSSWLPINAIWINDLSNINFDFSNKEKLYNKIKTYLLVA